MGGTVINIGKTRAQNKALDDLLASPHRIRIRVRLLDLNHNYLKDLTDFFADGSVSVDTGAACTRALDLVLLDPFNKVHLDPDSPSRASIFMSDMVSVVYVVKDPNSTATYEIPIFCGPIDDVDRDDVFLTVKCLGKEALSLNNAWRGKTFKKGEKKTDVIREIMRRHAGETRFNIPDRKEKLPNDIKLSRDKTPWSVAQKVARSMGMQLFYDGRGICVLRRRPKNPVFTFNSKYLTQFPKVAYDLSKTINAVQVIGKKPKKAKKKIKYTAVAQRRHPLSPWRLGRAQAPRYLWTVIEDESIESKEEARKVARRELGHGLQAGVDVTFEGIPHPRLQELDPCRVRVGEVAARFPMKKFTIPLTAGDDSSYGYLRRVRPKGGHRGVKTKKKDRGKGSKGKP